MARDGGEGRGHTLLAPELGIEVLAVGGEDGVGLVVLAELLDLVGVHDVVDAVELLEVLRGKDIAHPDGPGLTEARGWREGQKAYRGMKRVVLPVSTSTIPRQSASLTPYIQKNLLSWRARRSRSRRDRTETCPSL